MREDGSGKTSSVSEPQALRRGGRPRWSATAAPQISMRVLAVFAGSFSAGIFLAQFLVPDGWMIPGAAVCFLAACGALCLPAWWRRRMLLIFTALSLALGWNWLYLRQVQRPMERLAGMEGVVSATLCEYPAPTDFGARVTVRLEGVFPGKAVLYGDAALLDLCPGQTIRSGVEFRSAVHVRDTDITQFTSKGVFLLMVQRGEAVSEEGTRDSIRWWPVRVGRAMREQIACMFDGDTAAFLTAILTGDRSGLSAAAASELSEAGLSHVLAVSGMHCGYLLVLTIFVFGRSCRRLLAGVTIPLLCFYALLTGGSPSILRACFMMACFLLAPLFNRDNDPPTALTAALFCILLTNPCAAASISLQLSFGAMAGLLWVSPKLFQALLGGRERGPIVQFIALSVSASVGALVFTAPLSLFYFGVLSFLSPLSSLLCLWAVGLVFLFGLLAVVLSFVWLPLGSLAGIVPGVLIRFILTVSHLLTRIPGHALYEQNPYLWLCLLFCYLLFALAFFLRNGRRRTYLTAVLLAASALLLTAGLGRRTLTQGAMDVLALDVGQGESVLFSSGGAFALTDCGSANSWYHPGDIAAGYLLTMGCGKLDALILTHYDADHVSGVELLLSRIPVKTLLVPDEEDDAGLSRQILAAASRHGVEVISVREKREIPFGNATLTVFPPLGSGGDNEQGLSVLASCGSCRFLLTGDMSGKTERELLESYDLCEVDALMAGHHGSKYATSEELLNALHPETVFISVGSNRYGHPAEDVLRRVQAAGAEVYRTDLQGTISWSVPAKQGVSPPAPPLPFS